ncbi:MAG: hypothetical protein WC312_01120 [Candidatus Omnitrophota bacterium]|jgi:23S rRNA (uracil1939-C5)-methyltransferase
MEITIQKIIYPGKSLAVLNNKTILTDEGLPNEIVEAKIVKEKKNYIEAKTVKIIKPSPLRAVPRCGHYKSCGPYQYIDYKAQLSIKESQLKEIFPDMPITITPSPEIWGYRNKIRLSVIRKDKRASLAYHAPETQDKFIEWGNECLLVSRNVNGLLVSVIEKINRDNLDSIEEIEIRESHTTKDTMATAYAPGKIENIQGKPYIEETISGKTFRIGPGSFFQINIPMLDIVLKETRKYLSRDKKEIIADLYCGIGTFGISLSDFAEEIIGIESDPANISFLKGNLKLNKIGNFRIYEGPCEKLFFSAQARGIDTLIVDPPRKGLDNMLCQQILLSPIKKILYLSCNPATLSRDLKILNASYTLKSLKSFDFFPHTPHIETLAFLEKKQL